MTKHAEEGFVEEALFKSTELSFFCFWFFFFFNLDEIRVGDVIREFLFCLFLFKNESNGCC